MKHTVTILIAAMSLALTFAIGAAFGAAFGGSEERTRQLNLAERREVEWNRRLAEAVVKAFDAGRKAQLDAEIREALGEEPAEPEVDLWLDLPEQ